MLPTDPAQAGLLATFSPTLKSKNRALETLLSVGTAGIAAGTDSQTDPAFAAMAADPASRVAFVAAVVALARDRGFDGLDVAWRFPASDVEMANFGFLVSEWRAAAPPGFQLTATVYFSNHVFDAPLPGVDYPSEAVARCLDWVNVVAFGLHPLAAGATNATAFDAPLYDRASHFSASYGVVSWIDAGVPASKVVMGLPLYARSWFLRNKANSGVRAPVVAAWTKQHGSHATGIMSYAEVQKIAAAGGDGRRAVTHDVRQRVRSVLPIHGCRLGRLRRRGSRSREARLRSAAWAPRLLPMAGELRRRQPHRLKKWSVSDSVPLMSLTADSYRSSSLLQHWMSG